MAQHRIPTYRLHKQSGQAVVTLSDGAGGRRDVLLGKHASPESKQEYLRAIAEWEARGRQVAPKPGADITVNELILEYLKWADGHYRKAGRRTNEYLAVKAAMRPLKALYGNTLVAELGPMKVKLVREQMIRDNWSRGFINRSVARFKRMLRWAVENELAEPAVHQSVSAISGLLPGRTAARETPGRSPVPDADIEGVRQVVKQKTRDLIDLQLFTAARPGELLNLTWSEIDENGEVWTARLKSHKNEHHGKERILFFGPKAQLILVRYRKPDKTALIFGRVRYRDRIATGCRRAGVKPWCPHALRHTAATRLREEFGIEAAQVLCGHSGIDMTLHYAKQNEKVGRDVARKIG